MYYESDRVEFKSMFTKDIVKEIIAFLNTSGGKIYVGVDDKGCVIGVDDIDGTLNQLSSTIQDNIQPDAKSLIRIELEEDNVICINVFEGSNKPYYIKGKGLRPEGVYVRLGAASVQSSEIGIKRMLIQSANISYEKLPSIQQELTFEKTRMVFLEQQINFEEKDHRNLMLVNNRTQFNNAGLILSDQSNHSVKIAVFSEKDEFEFLDRREITGSIFDVLEKTLDYIHLNNHLKSRVESYRRKESYDYDSEIIREGIMNALIHRDYSFSGSIFVRIYVNRIEIVSLGGLTFGLSMDDINAGISQSRNPILASIFYRLKYVEAYGTGIRKIRSEYSDYSLSQLIKVTNNTFKLILWNKNYSNNVQIKKEEEAIYSVLSTDEKHVMSLLDSYDFITRLQVQESMKIGQTKAGIILKSLNDKGYLMKNGKGKKTVYLTKD